MKIRLLILLTAAATYVPYSIAKHPDLKAENIPLIQMNNMTFKDFDKDGKLSPFEDWRLTPQERSQDLLGRMQLTEKVGLMLHASAPAVGDLSGLGNLYDFELIKSLILNEHVKSFITRLDAPPAELSKQNNQLQAIAEQSRLGIPLTISIDPRHHYVHSLPVKPSASGFTQWPNTLGLAAIGSEKITQQFGDISRQEYRAIGVTQLLGPQADLATEPRWSRYDGTFGEDPELVKKMVHAYIIGAQKGDQGLHSESLSTIIKHWVGYGAAENGYDSHHEYGKHALFEGNNKELDTHIYPFLGAFEANVSGVMPTYSILKNAKYQGKAIDPVGAGFNRYLLQDLLRQKYQFKGVIMSDWLITEDCVEKCITGYDPGEKLNPHGMPWGVENLTRQERFVKAIDAGIDQFGGVSDSTDLQHAIDAGKISQARIDESVLRILEQKFALGQFENPFVVAEQASQIIGNSQSQHAANQAARASLVLLKNNEKLLPLKKGTKVYLHGIDKESAEKAGLLPVNSLDKADIALIRTTAPYEQLHKNFYFGANFHEGALNYPFDHPDLQVMRKANLKKVPVIATIYLDRPAVLTGMDEYANVLLANFGITDNVLLSALRDNKPFTGKLPFELPSSMQAVLEQQSSLPHDSKEPRYPIGFSL